MIKDAFPILVIDELLDNASYTALASSQTKNSSEYHQVRMRPDDIHKMMFCTLDGLYKFLVMPFSLSNLPAMF